jgi:DNA polymerase V
MALYDRIVNPHLLVRRVTLSAGRVTEEGAAEQAEPAEQLNLFTDYQAEEKSKAEEAAALEREKQMQRAILTIKKKYGKNAILKGMNLQEGATTVERNNQIGGHKA